MEQGVDSAVFLPGEIFLGEVWERNTETGITPNAATYRSYA
jgi:hypothetical protein